MINVNVFSEEKAWSKRLKNKDLFFKKNVKLFQKNISSLKKMYLLLYYFQIIKILKN